MAKKQRCKKPNHPRDGSGRKPKTPTVSKIQKSNNVASKKNSKQRSDRDMDDVAAQLQRQRQKSKALAAENTKNAEPLPTDSKATRLDKYDAAKCESSGDFQYDPVLKKYFPKSSFESHGNNDVCIQRIQKKKATNELDANITKKDSLLINENPFLTKDNVTDEDMIRVIFRGIRLPTNRCIDEDISNLISQSGKKSKKQRNNTHLQGKNVESYPPTPCSERNTLLLTTSLEYCTIAQKRNAIASMLRPMSIARTAKVVSTQSTLEMIQSHTKRCMHSYIDLQECAHDEPTRLYAGSIQCQQSGIEHSVQDSPRRHVCHLNPRVSPPEVQRWFSMLHPLKAPQETHTHQQPPWSPTVPYDCKCKSYLHPTAPTFDVLPGSDRNTAATPYMATISNDAVYYRTPYSVEGHSAWELESFSNKFQCQGVRFAPYYASESVSGRGVLEDSFVGCLIYDYKDDKRNFTLQNTGTIMNRGSREVDIYELVSHVNDFCFTPDTTLQHPGIVAFAHGADTNTCCGASFLDLSSRSYFSARDNWSNSEPLCLQFRKNNDKNHVLFGHRNGCVSMIDTRSEDAIFATSISHPAVSFGSATSIQPLQKDDNLVAVKGSFGPCRIFDLRRLSNNNDASSHYQQSMVLELSIPDSMVHQTMSAKCTGLAIDPTGSIAIAPFAGSGSGSASASDNNIDILFAMWDIGTGALIRTLDLNRVNKCTGCSAFCELSSVITSGYEMLCKSDSDAPIITSESNSFGLWFKTNVVNAPPDGGGIHHISF